MGLRFIVSDRAEAGSDRVALYDSTSGWAFGPVFASEEDAEAFLLFAKTRDDRDLRTLTNEELSALYSAFVDAREPASF